MKLLKGTVSGVYSEELEKRDYEFSSLYFHHMIIAHGDTWKDECVNDSGCF